MPDNRVKATSSIGLIAAFMATVPAADDLTRPIQVSARNPHFLAQPDGQPFFWLGDTAWSMLQRLDREEIEAYLKNRAGKGFNVIQAVAMGGPVDGLESPNRYGELALIGNDPARPNPKYFEHIDWAVGRATYYRLRIALLPTWGSYTIGGFGGGKQVFDPETARIYGRWLGARYRGKGIIWVLGGDTNPLWPRGIDPSALQGGKSTTPPDLTLVDYRPIYDAMAEGIVAGDGGDPFITFHPSPIAFPGMAEPRTSRYFHDRPWFDMNMLQSSHYKYPVSRTLPLIRSDFNWIGPYNYEPIMAEYRSSPTRPVIDGEPRYENMAVDVKYDPARGSWTTCDTRNAAYHAVFAGAAGHTFGNTSVYLSHDPARVAADSVHAKDFPDIGGSWRQQLDSPGAAQMRHLKNLMLSRPYFSRIPDQALLVGGAGEGTLHIGATRDKSGSYAMVYVPDGRPISVDLGNISGSRAIAWWSDPRTGAATRIEGTVPTTGVGEFKPPSTGQEADWVLVVDDEDAGFGPPGAMTE